MGGNELYIRWGVCIIDVYRPGNIYMCMAT